MTSSIMKVKLYYHMKLALSLVIITLNEESNIERCIRSVPFASDIVVVDSHSQDFTRELAAQLGARVFKEDWLGYGPQKASAVEKAKYDWILCLDADEGLSSGLSAELIAKWKSLEAQTGYEFPRKSFYLGRWITHGGWFPDYQLRLFNRKFSKWDSQPIHEKVKAEKVQRFNAPINHWVFKNVSHQIVTNDRYSSLQAQEQFAKGQRFSLLKMLFKPVSKFVECYFLKLGFLDGLPGFFIAVSAGYSVFSRWAKIWERQYILKS